MIALLTASLFLLPADVDELERGAIYGAFDRATGTFSIRIPESRVPRRSQSYRIMSLSGGEVRAQILVFSRLMGEIRVSNRGEVTEIGFGPLNNVPAAGVESAYGNLVSTIRYLSGRLPLDDWLPEAITQELEGYLGLVEALGPETVLTQGFVQLRSQLQSVLDEVVGPLMASASLGARAFEGCGQDVAVGRWERSSIAGLTVRMEIQNDAGQILYRQLVRRDAFGQPELETIEWRPCAGDFERWYEERITYRDDGSRASELLLDDSSALQLGRLMVTRDPLGRPVDWHFVDHRQETVMRVRNAYNDTALIRQSVVGAGGDPIMTLVRFADPYSNDSLFRLDMLNSDSSVARSIMMRQTPEGGFALAYPRGSDWRFY